MLTYEQWRYARPCCSICIAGFERWFFDYANVVSKSDQRATVASYALPLKCPSQSFVALTHAKLLQDDCEVENRELVQNVGLGLAATSLVLPYAVGPQRVFCIRSNSNVQSLFATPANP